MKENIFALIGLALFLGFIYAMHFSLYYMECYHARISEIINFVVLVVIIGLLIFGDKATKLSTLVFIVILLIVAGIESIFSFKGVISEVAEKAIACKK